MTTQQTHNNEFDAQEELRDSGDHIHRLLDAIELIEINNREDARMILRSLIHENSDFEEAWLWMSVVVDSLDQAVICLDNVLRINPTNINAATALHQLYQAEYVGENKRAQLRTYRDLSVVLLWMLILGLLFAILISSFSEMATRVAV